MITKGFPKYFQVDDVFVKVYFEDKEFVGINDLGNPYQPYKAMSDGREITKDQFDEGSKKRRIEFPPSTGIPTA